MGDVFFVLFIILMLSFLVAVFSRGQQGNGASRAGGQRRRGVPGHAGSEAARLAMQRADYAGADETEYVQVLDIGLLAYRHTNDPKLVRYGDVLMDTHHLRPFVELWLPYRARGTVRFEMVDGEGRLRYADESAYDLVRGPNTLLPNTWLPLREKTVMPGQWRLRVLANNALLASHVFGWRQVGGGVIQEFVAADGEMSATLIQALERRQASQAMSLNDLLADQEEWTG
jgi:hypothetical protein